MVGGGGGADVVRVNDFLWDFLANFTKFIGKPTYNRSRHPFI
jgi:hypothetical protein